MEYGMSVECKSSELTLKTNDHYMTLSLPKGFDFDKLFESIGGIVAISQVDGWVHDYYWRATSGPYGVFDTHNVMRDWEDLICCYVTDGFQVVCESGDTHIFGQKLVGQDGRFTALYCAKVKNDKAVEQGLFLFPQSFIDDISKQGCKSESTKSGVQAMKSVFGQ